MPAHTKTQRLIDDISNAIESGEYQPGAKLPSSRELCIEHSVSMMVVRTAMERLKARKLIDGVPGSGYYVRHPGYD